MKRKRRKYKKTKKVKRAKLKGLNIVILKCKKCKQEFNITVNDISIYTEKVRKNWICLSCK